MMRLRCPRLLRIVATGGQRVACFPDESPLGRRLPGDISRITEIQIRRCRR